jgi:hypothetical protein
MGYFFSQNSFTARKFCLNLNQNDYKFLEGGLKMVVKPIAHQVLSRLNMA